MLKIWICPLSYPNASITIDKETTLCGRTGHFWAFRTKHAPSWRKLAIGDHFLFFSKDRFRFHGQIVEKFNIPPAENIFNGSYPLGFKLHKLCNVDITRRAMVAALGYKDGFSWRSATCLKAEHVEIVKTFLHQENLVIENSEVDSGEEDSSDDCISLDGGDNGGDNGGNNGGDNQHELPITLDVETQTDITADVVNMEWEVDEISGDKVVNGKTFYKVRWMCTWEPEENLEHAQQAIASYNNSL